MKLVSFDLDGTLTDLTFADSVWLEGIPYYYSIKTGLTFEAARKAVRDEYGKIGRKRLEWYDLGYWINQFGLSVSPIDVLNSFSHRIKVFPEVPTALRRIKKSGVRMVILTNARREFVDLELDKSHIGNCFERIFSSTSDFGLIKNSAKVFKKVCDLCGVTPEEMVHVGDDPCFDFDIPKRIGIRAFHLDRAGKREGKSVIHNLTELIPKLEQAI